MRPLSANSRERCSRSARLSAGRCSALPRLPRPMRCSSQSICRRVGLAAATTRRAASCTGGSRARNSRFALSSATHTTQTLAHVQSGSRAASWTSYSSTATIPMRAFGRFRTLLAARPARRPHCIHDIVPGDEGLVGGVPLFWDEVKRSHETTEYVEAWGSRGVRDRRDTSARRGHPVGRPWKAPPQKSISRLPPWPSSRRKPILRRIARSSGMRWRPAFIRRRQGISRRYIAGSGLEIGGLNAPLKVPAAARVRYVDRAPVAELRKQYPDSTVSRSSRRTSSTMESVWTPFPMRARTSSLRIIFLSTARIRSLLFAACSASWLPEESSISPCLTSGSHSTASARSPPQSTPRAR